MAGRRTINRNPFLYCKGEHNGAPCPLLAYYEDTLLCKPHDQERTCEKVNCDKRVFSGAVCKYHYYKDRRPAPRAVQEQIRQTFTLDEIRALHQIAIEELTKEAAAR